MSSDASKQLIIDGIVARINQQAAKNDAKPPARILLIEDDLISMEVMLHHLMNAGYHVSIAPCGREAEAQCSAATFDLILTDVELPDITGTELTMNLRNGVGPNRQTPIIAMTAHTSGHTHTQCRKAGISHILTKPVRRQALLDTLATWQSATPAPVGRVAEQPVDVPLDWPQALTEFNNDAAALEIVTEDFMTATGGRLVCMREALAGADWEALRRQAHAITGGASNLCAVPISSAAAGVEEALRRQDFTACTVALAILENKFAALRKFMAQLHK
jgi:CheY-like chemotaxis protein/HPt (histidine-containing phosphotransfer) domain-containing protein